MSAIESFLNSKESKQTQAKYRQILGYFFGDLTEENVMEFLQLPQGEAVLRVRDYKAKLKQQGLSNNTINLRINCLKSLVKFAREIERCSFVLSAIKSSRTIPYKDTRGITGEEFRQIIAKCDRNTVIGLRDYAILALIWTCCLRRGAVSSLDVEHFKPPYLYVLSKGFSDRRRIELPSKTVNAIAEWLTVYQPKEKSDPLFVSVLLPRHRWSRLLGGGIYKRCRHYGAIALLDKSFNPHRAKHGGISTTILTTGDLRQAMKIGNHSSINTTLIYDDNLRGLQREASEMLSSFL